MKDLCEKINDFGKGIGNESRYRILEAVLKGQKTVSQLVKSLKLSQPAVSQHLKTLKSAKIVVAQRRGQEIFYSANGEYMLSLLKNLSTRIEKRKKLKIKK